MFNTDKSVEPFTENMWKTQTDVLNALDKDEGYLERNRML